MSDTAAPPLKGIKVVELGTLIAGPFCSRILAEFGAESARQVQHALDSGTRCIVFDIPLLVESGRWRQQVDVVTVVDCSVQTQIARVVARSALTAQQAQAIVAAQAVRGRRLAAADIVLCNEGLTLDQLQALVTRAAKRFGL